MNYLLLFLYIYQSSMLSIFTQIMPILLAEHGFNYEQQGLFSLVAYPFFFKIIFAPIIDLFHIKSLGRRRSYILPCTILMSFNLFWQSSLDIQQNYLLFCLIGLFNATFLGMQDIAIDGFAADLCKKSNESSAHILNVGYTIGSSFLANFIFHSLNKYQLCSLSTYLKMISVFGLMMAAYLFLKVKEEQNTQQIKKLTGFRQVIKGIFENENLITLSLLLFFDRYGVAPIESTFRIKLTELKFNKAYVSFMDTAIIPLKIAVGFVYHKYFNKYNFEYYGYVQGLRLISCLFAILTVFLVDVVKVNDTLSYIALFIASTTWWIVFNLTFIVRGNFQMKITTPGYEATTLALMNSLGSLGGKTGFSLCMFLTEYVNYYCFACFALIAQLLFTLKSIKLYKRLYSFIEFNHYIMFHQRNIVQLDRNQNEVYIIDIYYNIIIFGNQIIRLFKLFKLQGMAQELYKFLVLAYTSTDNAIRQQAEIQLMSRVIENIQNFSSIAQIAKSQDSMQSQAASLLNSAILKMLSNNIELQLEHAQLVFDVIISQQTSLKCKQLLQKSMSLLIKLNKKIKPEIENKMKQLVKSDQIWEIQSGLFFFKTLIDSLDLSQFNLVLNQGLDWIKDFFDLIYPLFKILDEQSEDLTEEYIITIRYYTQIVYEYCEKLFKQKAHNKESLIPLQNMMFKLNSFQLTLFAIFKYSPQKNIIKSCIISCTNIEQFDNRINEVKMFGLKCLQILINSLLSKSKNEQRNSVFYSQQSNLNQLLLYSILAYTRQARIQEILQKQFLPSILSSMLRLLAHLGGQVELYPQFQDSKGLLITDIIYPFLITTKNEYQIMKEQPEEFVNIALDVVDKQESDLPKTAATTLLETLCDHIDGSTSYLAQMAIVVISSSILELSQSQLSKQQQQIILQDIQQISDKKLFQEFTPVDRIESSLMILTINVDYGNNTLTYVRIHLKLFKSKIYSHILQDIIQLMEQLLQSNLVFFTNTSLLCFLVIIVIICLKWNPNFLLQLINISRYYMLNYIQLLITYAKPSEPVVLYQSIDALKDIFEDDELKHKTGDLVVNVFPSLINGLAFSTYERHFEMIGNLLKTFPSIFITTENYIINLVQILVQRILQEETLVKTTNDSTRYIHLNRCWNLLRQLPTINEFSPLLLKIEQTMQPIYQSLVIQETKMNFDEDLILFISSVIQKLQTVSQFQKEILPYFSNIITRQSGRFVYLYETLNMYMYYGRNYFLQEQAQHIYFNLCLQSLMQEEAFEDIDLAEGALLIQLGIQVLQNDISQTILAQVFQKVLQLITKENVTGIIRSRITAIFLVAFYYIPQLSYQILGEHFQNVYQKVLITQYHPGYDIKLFIITICKLIQSTPQLLNAELIQIIIRNLENQEQEEKPNKTDFDEDMMDDDDEEEDILEEEEKQQAKQQIEQLKSDLQKIDEFTIFRNTILGFKTQHPMIIELIKQTLDNSSQQKLNNYLKFMRIDNSENARKVMTTGRRRLRLNI